MRGSRARRRRVDSRALAGALGCLLCSCRRPLPGHGQKGPAGDGDELPIAPALLFDPPPTVDGVSPVTRFAIDLDTIPADARVILVTGELTMSQLRDLARPALPATLSERRVEALAWADDQAGTIFLSPLSSLAAGKLYTVGLSSPPNGFSFQVAPAGADRLLSRLWPPPSETMPAVTPAVWCGVDPLAGAEVEVVLAPAGLPGSLVSGTGCSLPASQCLTFVPRPGAWPSVTSLLPALSPPAVTLQDGTRVALEPVAMFPSSIGARPPAVACAADEIPFGRGCAEVEDDRIAVRPPSGPLLWTIDGGEGAAVRASGDGRPFVVRPLSTSLRYRVATLDATGLVEETEVALVRGSARSHVVLNEVMANPAGAEPAQEWIELYNDGTEPQSLAGYAIDDGASRVSLPETILPAGAYALVVSQAYMAGDGVDPPPAADTPLVRVPSLGQGGLSNEGERLVLRDAGGGIRSIFPAFKTKNGVSIARIAPDALDDDPASFATSPNGSATPGAPNW